MRRVQSLTFLEDSVMSASTEFERVLNGCYETLDLAPDGNLPFGWRLRIWDALDAEFPRDGRRRYSLLCYRSARMLLSTWDSRKLPPEMSGVPRRLLELFSEVLCERNTIVSEYLSSLWQAAEVADTEWWKLSQNALPCPASTAAWAALSYLVGFPHRESLDNVVTEESLDLGEWDAPAHAAWGVAGPLGDNSLLEVRRSFWRDFLRTAHSAIGEPGSLVETVERWNQELP